jgi:hypothetical protein
MDDWLETKETVDPEVRAYVGSLVNAVSLHCFVLSLANPCRWEGPASTEMDVTYSETMR